MNIGSKAMHALHDRRRSIPTYLFAESPGLSVRVGRGGGHRDLRDCQLLTAARRATHQFSARILFDRRLVARGDVSRHKASGGSSRLRVIKTDGSRRGERILPKGYHNEGPRLRAEQVACVMLSPNPSAAASGVPRYTTSTSPGRNEQEGPRPSFVRSRMVAGCCPVKVRT